MKDIKPLNVITETPETHKAFVKDVVKRVEEHIKGLGVVKGLFVRNTYAALKAVRPGYVEHIIEVLSKDYIVEFAEMHEAYRSSQNLPAEKIQSEVDYILAHRKEADIHFWNVAERYAEKRKDSVIGKIYHTAKPMIEKNLGTVYEVIFDEIAKYTVFEVE